MARRKRKTRMVKVRKTKYTCGIPSVTKVPIEFYNVLHFAPTENIQWYGVSRRR